MIVRASSTAYSRAVFNLISHVCVADVSLQPLIHSGTFPLNWFLTMEDSTMNEHWKTAWPSKFTIGYLQYSLI
jgi:hypothetical protein